MNHQVLNKEYLRHQVGLLIIVLILFVIIAGNSIQLQKYSIEQHFERDGQLSMYSKDIIFPSAYIYTIVMISIFLNIFMITGLFRSYNRLYSSTSCELETQVFKCFIVMMIFCAQIMNMLVPKPSPSFFYECNYKGYKTCVDTNNLAEYLVLTNPYEHVSLDNCYDKSNINTGTFPNGPIVAIVGIFTYSHIVLVRHLKLCNLFQENSNTNMLIKIIYETVFVLECVGLCFHNYYMSKNDLFGIVFSVGFGWIFGHKYATELCYLLDHEMEENTSAYRGVDGVDGVNENSEQV